MYREVLVGVDGRAGGRDAIALARLLVGPDDRLTLAHISRSARAQDARALLERERAASGVDAELLTGRASSVGDGLHELAEGIGADLLVVGSCARGLAGRVFVGNDTRATIVGAPCAVAVAPLRYEHDLGALATIGIGYDGSPESEAALAVAREIAAARHTGLRALEVVQLPAAPYTGFATVVWTEALDDMVTDAERGLAALPDVEGSAVLGLADDELAAFSRRVDLLLVGGHPPGARRRRLSGSTLAHLAANAACPLLIVPPDEAARANGLEAPLGTLRSATQ